MPNSVVQILFNNNMRGREVERNRKETGGERMRDTDQHNCGSSSVLSVLLYSRLIRWGLSDEETETVQNFSLNVLANKGINDHWL